ncbi:hypothetical protein BRARA_E00323 [Brassica rapa]|uniref:Ribose-phosphate pyrophosphokinase N-terminal domain-containing protein n=1 Tax=Brassica campestris TaxID=3711 RepID=A0A397ZCT1_BRACM|nr:hypothetical protein BRARA_E00323 [Brassica rapa]
MSENAATNNNNNNIMEKNQIVKEAIVSELQKKKVHLFYCLESAKVSAYVTHGVFPNSSWERFTHKNNGVEEAFAYFWITDSCPQTVKSIGNKAPFEVLSLAGSIADALQI